MNLIYALTAAALVALPAFAQDAATLACAEYAALDNAGKMAIQAELESLASEMANNGGGTSANIAAQLNDHCSANPNQLVQEAWAELSKM